MALSEQKAKDLATIEPPASMTRIVRFLEALAGNGGAALRGLSGPNLLAPNPAVGLSSLVAGRALTFGVTAGGDAFRTLMLTYSLRVEELEAFIQWLVRWEAKRQEMETIADPTIYHEDAADGADSGWTAGSHEPDAERPYRPARRIPGRATPSRTTRTRAATPEAPLAPDVSPEMPIVAHRGGGEEHPPQESFQASERTREQEDRRAPAQVKRREPEPTKPEPLDLRPFLERATKGMSLASLSIGSAVAGAAIARPVVESQVARSIEERIARSGFAPQSTPLNVPRRGPVALNHSIGSTYNEGSRTGEPYAPVPYLRPAPSTPDGFSAIPPPPEPPAKTAPSFTLAPRPQYRDQLDDPASLRTQEGGASNLLRAPSLQAPVSPETASTPTLVTPVGASDTSPSLVDRILANVPVIVAGVPLVASLLPHGQAPKKNPPKNDPPTDGGAGDGEKDGGKGDAKGSTAKPGDVIGRMWSGAATPQLRMALGGRSVEPAGSDFPIARGADTGMSALDPTMGQITIVAPPMRVASAETAEAGSAIEMDWRSLAANAGPLTPASLAQLSAALPAGAQAIYPALPAGRMVPGAFNLRLGETALRPMLTRAYGEEATPMAGRLASLSAGEPPGSSVVQASLVPYKAPASAKGSVLSNREGPADGPGALGQVGGAQAKRGGPLDFLGLPVRMAPTLGGRAELRDEVAVRSAAADVAANRPVSPEKFGMLRNRLLPGMQSVSVEPSRAAWERAAPAYGLAGGDPMTVLAPDAKQSRRPLGAAGPTPATPNAPARIEPMLGTLASHAAAPRSAPGLTPADPLGRMLSATSGSGLLRVPTIGSPLAVGAPRMGHSTPANLASIPSASMQAAHPSAVGHRPSLGFGHAHSAPSTPSLPGGLADHGSTSPTYRPEPLPSVHAYSPHVGAAAPMPSLEHGLPSSNTAGGRGHVFGPGMGHATDSSGAGSPARAPTRTHGASAHGPSAVSKESHSGSSPIAAYGPSALDLPALSQGARPSLTRSHPSPVVVRAPVAPLVHTPVSSAMSAPRVRIEHPRPEMLYAAPTARPSRTAIQTSRGGHHAPASASKGSTGSRADDAAKGKRDPKAKADEVDLLAAEVWSVLKRRIAYEAERRGRW